MRKPIHPSPARELAPHERLLLGNSLVTALDTADPEAWIDLDRRIRATTGRGDESTPPGAPTASATPGAPSASPGTGSSVAPAAASPRTGTRAPGT